MAAYQLIIVALFLTISTVQQASCESLLNKKYFVSQKKATWSEARILCEREGRSLATVMNAEEQGLLRTVLKNNKAGWLDSYWIAGTNVGCDGGEFCWFGNPSTPVTFSNWGSGGFNNGETCIKILNQQAEWLDWDCSWKFSYVCEYY